MSQDGGSTAGGSMATVTGPPWYRRRLGLILLAPLAVGLLVVAGVAFAFWRIYSGAEIPQADALEIPDPTIVLDASGDRVETFELAAVRQNINLENLPDHVWQAVLAAEDRSFYDHGGFSVRGIARAAWANLTRGERAQGGSTINQQYVALAVEEIDDSYVGKFREVAVAARLDDEFSKDRILEMYLNAVPLGRTAIGIQAAAQTYFGVDSGELDLEQAAVLAGMIAAPTTFDPERNPEGAAGRRDFVLDGMVQMGAIEQAEADEHVGTELPDLRDDPLVTFGSDAYFLDLVRDEVPALIEEEWSDVGTGLIITTTLDRRAQALADDALAEHLDGLEYSGSIITVDPANGAVRALMGGRDFADQQFNVATESRRQIGSAFKTFVLADLVRQGYDPDSSRIDAPREYRIEDDPDEAVVGNYSGRGHGEVSIREATVDSINTAYVQLGEELGLESVATTAEELGVGEDLSPFPSISLGAADLRPLDVAAAYATLAGGGTYHRPYVIERIETHDGEVLYEHEAEPDEVLTEQETSVVTDVLVDVVEQGTGTAASLPDRPVAGKTGTTNESRDAWFVGYTPEQATAVWIGNLDNTPMPNEAGGGIPATIWSSYAGELLEDVEPSSFPTPDRTGLRPLTGLEAPEPEPRPDPTPDDGAREEEDDEGAGDDEGDDTSAEFEDDDGDDGRGDGRGDGGGDGGDGGDDDGTDDGGNDGGDDDGTDDGGNDGGGGDGNGGNGNGNDRGGGGDDDGAEETTEPVSPDPDG